MVFLQNLEGQSIEELRDPSYYPIGIQRQSLRRARVPFLRGVLLEAAH